MGTATATERDAELAARMAQSIVDRLSLERACWSLCAHLGFDFIDFSFRAAGATLESSPAIHVSSFPSSWRSHYECSGIRRTDPVLRSAFQGAPEPIFWEDAGSDPSGLAATEARWFLSEADQHGARIVVSHAIPGHHGEICLLILGRTTGRTRAPGNQKKRAVLGFRIRAFLSVLMQGALNTRQQIPRPRLSIREKDVLALVRQGGSTQSIAQALNIAERTVYEHLTTAGSKLDVTGRHRIAQRALELGLLDPRGHVVERNLEAAAGQPATLKREPDAEISAPAIVQPDALAAGGQELFEWSELQSRLGEFSIVYQPILSAASRKPLSCESLLRWQHPSVKGFYSPSSFIPRLEQTGAIIGIGLWVIERVLDQIQRWRSAKSEPLMSVGVNVSPIQINQAGFSDGVLKALTAAKVDPSQLFLEITESQPIDWSQSAARSNLEALHRGGIRIFLDDFGCGHASITNLQHMRFIHGVKIDSSLVAEVSREPRVAMIVRSIARLAADMGIQVVGEGVETESQLSALQDLGVDQVQGFLFSRGVDPERLLEWTRLQAAGTPARSHPAPPRSPGVLPPGGSQLLSRAQSSRIAS